MNFPPKTPEEAQFMDTVFKLRDVGFGRMMQLISEYWRDQDPSGALKVGDTFGSPDSPRMAQKIVNFLNAASRCDPAAIYALCVNRIPWNGIGDIDLPLVVDDDQKKWCSVGMLGFLNGLVSHEGDVIEMKLTDDPIPQFLGFQVRAR